VIEVCFIIIPSVFTTWRFRGSFDWGLLDNHTFCIYIFKVIREAATEALLVIVLSIYTTSLRIWKERLPSNSSVAASSGTFMDRSFPDASILENPGIPQVLID
jgi:hypothetical protein